MCWGDRCEGLFSSGLPSGNCLQKFSKKKFLSTAVSGIVHGGGPGVVHAPATLRAGTTRLARTQAQRYLQDSTTFSGGKGHHQRVPSTEAPSTHTCPRAALAPPRRRAVAPRWALLLRLELPQPRTTRALTATNMRIIIFSKPCGYFFFCLRIFSTASWRVSSTGPRPAHFDYAHLVSRLFSSTLLSLTPPARRLPRAPATSRPCPNTLTLARDVPAAKRLLLRSAALAV